MSNRTLLAAKTGKLSGSFERKPQWKSNTKISRKQLRTTRRPRPRPRRSSRNAEQFRLVGSAELRHCRGSERSLKTTFRNVIRSSFLAAAFNEDGSEPAAQDKATSVAIISGQKAASIAACSSTVNVEQRLSAFRCPAELAGPD